MFKIIKKHQKKLMTVIAIGSMIAFVAAFGAPGGGSAQNPVTAHIGDEDVHAMELADSRRLWGILHRTGLSNVNANANNQPIRATYLLSPEAVDAINQEPDTFLMLRKEAAKMGLAASPDNIEELMHNQVTLAPTASVEEAQELRNAFSALLVVKAAYERAASAVKSTEPQRQYDAAMMGQSITLKYISYDANEFKAAVPPPTPEQLRQQFDKYANFQPDQPQETTNPFGFGYMYPPRVMLEYLAIRRADLRDAARAAKDAPTWEIDARKQYHRNTTMYPTSRPSSQSEFSLTAPATRPATAPLVFADYREQIISELLEADENALLENVRKKIVTTLEADWAAYRAALPPSTQPATRPSPGRTTALGVSYDSPEYLPKLALAIQKEFKVLPQTVRLGKDWMSQKDLALVPDISGASLPSEEPRGERLRFSDFAITYLDVFGHKASPRDLGPTLSLLSPSPGLTDLSRNLYFFRAFASDPAHTTTDLTPFGAQVEADYKLTAAMAAAHAQIDKLAAIAGSSNLDEAAKSAGRKVFTTSRITGEGIAPNPELPLKPESQRTLVKAAFDLLKRGDDIKAGKATAVIELPLEGKVLLVLVAEVSLRSRADVAYLAEDYIGRQMNQRVEQFFRIYWFNPKEVEKRVNYRSETKKEKSPAA